MTELEKKQEEFIDSLYECFHPFFDEVSDYCRRGHTLNGRKMDITQVTNLLGRVKKAVAKEIALLKQGENKTLRDELIKFAQQFYADEETCIHNVDNYLKSNQ